MSGRASARHRKRRENDHGEHENHERWLLTYADMITLLMALFMVLFSISSVNVSKFNVLEQSLKSAFSGSILSGGRSILQSGADSTATHSASAAEVPSIVPLTPSIPQPVDLGSGRTELRSLQAEAQAASQEQSQLQALAHRLNAFANAHGWQHQVHATVQRRGLVVTVLTDKLLFESGQDSLRSAGLPILDEIATLLQIDPAQHPVVVEGYTDNVPIATSQFPSNWELSTGRASTVVRYLISRGVPESRLSAAGYADQFPVASNATAAGRALNRRVEVVLQRINPLPTQSP